jgi:hypothetical protein
MLLLLTSLETKLLTALVTAELATLLCTELLNNELLLDVELLLDDVLS